MRHSQSATPEPLRDLDGFRVDRPPFLASGEHYRWNEAAKADLRDYMLDLSI